LRAGCAGWYGRAPPRVAGLPSPVQEDQPHILGGSAVLAESVVAGDAAEQPALLGRRSPPTVCATLPTCSSPFSPSHGSKVLQQPTSTEDLGHFRLNCTYDSKCSTQ
jgi:hypothetical protein